MRKIISFIIALCIMITPVLPAYAADEEDPALAKIISNVKNVIEIPNKYTEFYCESTSYDEESSEYKIWSLYWSDPEDSGYIEVNVDWLGNVLYYDRYDYNSDEDGLGKVSRAQGEVTAKKILQKLYPQLASNLREINKEENRTYFGELSYDYQFYANGLPVSFINISISINKYTGELSSIYGVPEGFVLPNFPDPNALISKNEALKAFLENDLISLTYRYKYVFDFEDYSEDSDDYDDYDDERIEYYPAYAVGGRYVDAKTGEIVYDGNMTGEISFEDFITYVKAKAESSKEYETFTASEITELTKEYSLLTEQEAIAKIKTQIPANRSASLKKESANLDYYYSGLADNNYVWNIVFSDVYATIDAETGELLNYFYYNDRSKGSQNLSEEQCQTIADKYLKDKKPDIYAKSTLFSFSMEEQPDFYQFYYIREENGIVCEGNYAKIMVSSHNGQIYSYDCSWDNNATFPQVDGVMAESQLLDKIDAQLNYNLEYRQVGSENEIRLVYGFIEDTTESFDPYTGQELSYKGDPYEQDLLPSYTDIKGLYCEYAVTKLLENGYYLESPDRTKFKPKEKINQRSFFSYLYSQYYDSDDNEEFYNMLIEDGIITKEEIAPDKILTRQEAAKYIVKYLNLDLAGKYPDIYKVSFNDSIEEKYKGYAALANALGIIKGDSKGRFNGTAQMTNGEAAVVIYRLLTVKYGS